MNDLVLITPPVGEPVSVGEMYTQLGMVQPADDGLNNAMTAKLTGILAAARDVCETFTRTVFLTQTWLLKRDGFPCVDMRYDRYHHAIYLPKMPFQSIQSMQYVDETGVLQVLTQDSSYGTDPNEPTYGFQLDPGSDTNPARLLPPWAKPWPPTRRLPANVLVQFKCGFGGPITGATVAAEAAILVGPKFLQGDVGQPVVLPAAGANGQALATSIASVDVSGQATFADAAVTAVPATETIWVGKPIPSAIKLAILLQAEFFFTQGGDVDLPMPRVVQALLGPYRNLVA